MNLIVQVGNLAFKQLDLFALLLAPAGGDELQGVKRGIMEIADLILVNKADGDLRAQAMRTCADYAGALRLLRKRPQDPEDFPKALTMSALDGAGLVQGWDEMQKLIAWRRENGVWDKRRADQALYWLDAEVKTQLLERLAADAGHRDRLDRAKQDVVSGATTPARAAALVVAAMDTQGR